MKFKELASYLAKLETTSSRIDITVILAELFKNTTSKEIDKITYLVLGSLAPGFRGVVFNVAEKMMLQGIAKAYEKEIQSVSVLYRKLGDLGEAAGGLAEKASDKNKTKGYTVTEVYDRLESLANDSGEGSQDRKIEALAKLLTELDPLSVRFVARIPVGRLRLGFSDKTILDALSWMETGNKSKKAELEAAFNILPDVGLLAKHVKEMGIDRAVKNIKPELGVPLLPMLAARLKSPKEMIEKMKRVYVEPKFDGLRIQLHYKKKGFKDSAQKERSVKAFTRNLNETSWMFPELSDLGKYVNADEAILDTEAVGVDEERKKMANFQTTMTRRRKHDIENISAKISIKFNVFDIMYKDGKSLVFEPYDQRRMVLAKTVKSGKLIEVVGFEETTDPVKIGQLMQKELGDGLEGIIVKRFDSKYIAGRTGWRWVKMKEAESQKAKLADTIDCIVMGYYAGRGKRTRFGLGGFLVGIRDKQDVVTTLTKIGTGLSDDQFREMHTRLKKLEVKEKPKEFGEVNKMLTPDVWVTPSLVVEIAADEITKSPTHSSGYALRFPRLVKFRDDKSWDDATTATEVKKIAEIDK